jgi:MoaA/NifB/PqqE/SkfB family radical SAM enzyme
LNNFVKNNSVNAPKYIYLTLTDACNLKCIYCYATERKKRENANYKTWEKYVLDIIDFAGKPVFTFTGGEPLFIPYIFDLADYIKGRGCDCILLTNGTLINSTETADRVVQLFYMVKISLDTQDESISRELRGPGIVEKVRNAFNLLTSRKCNAQILATVTSKTYQNLESFSVSFNNQVQFQPLYQDIG